MVKIESKGCWNWGSKGRRNISFLIANKLVKTFVVQFLFVTLLASTYRSHKLPCPCNSDVEHGPSPFQTQISTFNLYGCIVITKTLSSSIIRRTDLMYLIHKAANTWFYQSTSNTLYPKFGSPFLSVLPSFSFRKILSISSASSSVRYLDSASMPASSSALHCSLVNEDFRNRVYNY